MRAARRGRAGFGLVDICVALVILAGSLGILVGTVVSGIRMSRSDEDLAQANQALRMTLARFNALTPQQVFAICNTDQSDDLDGYTSADYLGVAPHTLTDRHGAALSIAITFPTADGAPGVVREDLDLPALGLPRDLNADGVIDSNDHSGDFVLLPVALTLDWESSAGPQHVQMATILSD